MKFCHTLLLEVLQQMDRVKGRLWPPPGSAALSHSPLGSSITDKIGLKRASGVFQDLEVLSHAPLGSSTYVQHMDMVKGRLLPPLESHASLINSTTDKTGLKKQSFYFGIIIP